MREMIYVTYAGSSVERNDLRSVARQITSCLDDLGCPNDQLCAYDIGPKDWSFLRKQKAIAFLLDPYYEHGSENFDLRDILSSYNVPFTGPRKFASQKTADKVECKKFLAYPGIINISDTTCYSVQDLHDFMKKTEQEDFVIKPLNKGGGQDVELVSKSETDNKIPERLLKTYGKFMVEPRIEGQEMSVPVINSLHGGIKVLPVVGINLHGFNVFSARAKDTNNSMSMDIPAKTTPSAASIMSSFAKNAYEMLRFRGLLRVDFICNDNGVYFLEANAYPSLGRNFGISIPSARSVGIEQKHVVKWLIETADVGG